MFYNIDFLTLNYYSLFIGCTLTFEDGISKRLQTVCTRVDLLYSSLTPSATITIPVMSGASTLFINGSLLLPLFPTTTELPVLF